MKFQLGEIVSTSGALEVIHDALQTPFDFLKRHVEGDWGDMCDEDKQPTDTPCCVVGAYSLLTRQTRMSKSG